MGGKAQRIRDNIKQFLSFGSDKNTSIMRVFDAIKKQLVHDLTLDSFADMYAQTLVYGLFVARYYDDTPETFTRQEARDLIPKSNPLLQHFFDHITGTDFDGRLKYIVNELCEVFSHANIPELMKEYFKVDLLGESHKGPDPVIHFYEDFLNEYDEDLRKKMGAYYTPLPVVQFIVRSVDYLLEKEFGLANGLADTSKTESGIHKVQILDPAVGTGTFISDVIGKIYARILKSKQQGGWPSYVHNNLLPRLHGFELMMAPYTIAHLKLSMALGETGFKHFNRRLGIYLTNSLEESSNQENLLTGLGFSESISKESEEASIIKNKTPIMIVLGNPPYSGESMNPGYKDNDVYKFEPGTTQKLQERNSKWLNDDYVKFIRFAESMIEKTGEGVVGMITAHGYLDNPTFRGMRYHLMQTFDILYLFDLHGNANKKELAKNGEPDKNIFDIKTGVSIILAVKKKKQANKLAEVFRFDILGSRNDKFEFLNKHNVNDIKWDKITVSEPNYEFVARDEAIRSDYKKNFSIEELFIKSGVGIVTARDNFVISDSRNVLLKNAEKFINSDASTQSALCSEVGISDKKGWDALNARDSLRKESSLENLIKNIQYRPFDTKLIFYHPSLVWRHVDRIMKNFLTGDNYALVSVRQVKAGEAYQHVLISNNMVESTYLSNKTGEIDYVFPLYLYEDGARVPNFNKEIYNKIIANIKVKVEPENVLDYIYAVLHSLNYREKYKEFLKIDFPRVPYPKNEKQFFALTKLGEELRHLHLLESSKVNKFITTFSVAGDDLVEKVKFEDGKVFINKTQYFGGVPEAVWNFYIGGYQPAQKWLKDRKARKLTSDDMEHYQKMIVAMGETIRIMKEIDSAIKL
ncbi:MAG: N-6 DNA methylase [Candidatus Parcubacteria bacterium]|nr:N-6 DNA methylase [Candidatus Parcubacteria bacterium]